MYLVVCQAPGQTIFISTFRSVPDKGYYVTLPSDYPPLTFRPSTLRLVHMHAPAYQSVLRLPALCFRPLLDWEFGIIQGRLCPVDIPWSLVINILHAIIEILMRLSPHEPIDGAKQDIADAVAKLWEIHHPQGDSDGESQKSA